MARAPAGPPASAADGAGRATTPWVVCGGALFGIGIYTALLGPLLPDLAERTGIALGDAGAVFTALFAAAILSTFTVGRALDRYGYRLPLVFALSVNGVALLILPWVTSWPAMLAVAALIGLGDGGVVVAAHVLIARISPDDEAAALNRLNVFFGVGAVLGPALGALARASDTPPATVLAGAGAIQLAYAAVLLRSSLPSVPPGTAAPENRDNRLLSSPLLWLLGVLLLVYVGAEIGLGGWAFSYAREAAGIGAVGAALLSSGFWSALTLGRLCSPLLLRRLSPAALLMLAPAVAAAGTLLLVVAGAHTAALVAGVAITGFAFGPIWPVTFALAARIFVHGAGRASGVLGMVSAAGGLTVPWLQGRVLDAAGAAAGIAVTLAGCLLVMLLAVAVARSGAVRLDSRR